MVTVRKNVVNGQSSFFRNIYSPQWIINRKESIFYEQQHIHVVKSPKKVFPVFIVLMGDLKKTQAKCYCKFSQAAYSNVCCASSVLACSESTPLGGCLAL